MLAQHVPVKVAVFHTEMRQVGCLEGRRATETARALKAGHRLVADVV
jgi:hypothetical protein